MENKDDLNQQIENSFLALPKIYSNAVKISRTFDDFQIIFGHRTLDVLREKPLMIVEARALIQLSPQHFKLLVKAVSEQLAKYEKEFGIIQTPPENEDKEK